MHFEAMTVPGTGSRQDLQELTDRITADGGEPGSPLWRLVLVEGMANGGSAIILHVDQVFTDAIEFAFVLAELVRSGTTFAEWGASLWMMRCPGSV